MVLPIVLLIVGLALVVAEVFFVSMGLLSLLAGVAILAADLLAFEVSSTAGWTLIAAEVVLVPLLVWAAFRILPRVPFGRRMLLEGPVTAPSGGVPRFDDLVGREGEAATNLRPSGTGRFGDERLTVVATGRWVPRGARIRVVEVEGGEVRVRPTDPEAAGDDADAL